MSTILPEKGNPEGGGALFGQPVEEKVVEHGDGAGQVKGEAEEKSTRRRKSSHDDDRNSKLDGDEKQTAIDYRGGGGDDLAGAGGSTGRAACVLASDLDRLAARQGAAAGELLRVASSETAPSALVLDPRKDPRKDPAVLSALAALGQAVGLQAKAVGLMEEVVVRTVHSRVSGR